MKEELTTAMHAEFDISPEKDAELRALSLLQMERDGIEITDEDLQEYGFTHEQMEGYRKLWAHLLTK
jgi:hypothetical protein